MSIITKRHSSTAQYALENYVPKFKPLLPITSSIHPTIRLDLTNIPKTDKSVDRRLIRKIISEYPTHIVCITDGSKSRNSTGYAYSIQNSITANRLLRSASVFTAELTAIHSCLSQLTHTPLPPGHHYILLPDSLSSLLFLQDPYSINSITQRIHVILHTFSSIQSSVTFIWITSTFHNTT